MKNVLLFGVMLILLITGCNQTGNNPKEANLKTTIDSVSYGLGVLIADNLKKDQSLDSLDYDMFVVGFMARVDSTDIKISREEAQKILQAYGQQQIMAEAAKNKKAGEEFLVQNAQKEGVISLPDGLQYKILKEGYGKSPDVTDSVTVNYEGKTIDGKVFDSSYKNGRPITFPLKGVIEGWQEALSMMKPGAKWRIFVPSDLAYGERGVSNIIKPGSALIFDIELLKVNGK